MTLLKGLNFIDLNFINKEVAQMQEKKRLTHISFSLDEFLNTKLKHKDDLQQVIEKWDNIIDDSNLSENAKPVALKKDVLLIHVSSPVYIHHFQFFKSALTEKINTALDKKDFLKDIKFKVGKL